MAFSFSCMPAFAKVSPMKASSKEEADLFSNPKVKESEEKKKKKKQGEEVNNEKDQDKMEKKKKKSNLEQAASRAMYFQFHSRPGLL